MVRNRGEPAPRAGSPLVLLLLKFDRYLLNFRLGNIVISQGIDTDTVLSPVTIVPDQPQSDWLDLDEVCSIFKLSKNNIKNKTWRDSNGFPTHQQYKGAKVTFNRKEVEIWLNADKH